jgi:hypothetical protein
MNLPGIVQSATTGEVPMALATAPTTDAERTHRRARAAWSTAFGATNVAPVPTAIAVSGDTIYLGGSFINPMAGMPEFTYNRIARWDGSGWHRMGEGVDSAVHAIAVVGNDVYVGGEFSVAGGTVRAPGLARWDGAKWAPVAGGIDVRNGADFRPSGRWLPTAAGSTWQAPSTPSGAATRPSRPTVSRSWT